MLIYKITNTINNKNLPDSKTPTNAFSKNNTMHSTDANPKTKPYSNIPPRNYSTTSYYNKNEDNSVSQFNLHKTNRENSKSSSKDSEIGNYHHKREFNKNNYDYEGRHYKYYDRYDKEYDRNTAIETIKLIIKCFNLL